MITIEEAIRTFIAIDVPEDLKRSIYEIQQELGQLRGDRVAWVKTEGVHLTLKFLGDVSKETMARVIEAVRRSVQSAEDFWLTTTVKGGFPKLRHPKTLWIGVDGGEELYRLQKSIEAELERAGISLETAKFHPHLTVGRVKELGANSVLTAKFAEFPLDIVEWRVSKVNVMSSRLSSYGAEYDCIESIALKQIS